MGIESFVTLFSSSHWTWKEEVCGHCGKPSNVAVVATVKDKKGQGQLVQVCVSCRGVSVVRPPDLRIPATRPGGDVDGLGAEVAAAWQEARSALGAGAPTAAEHMCRKILIHIAVDHDAKEGIPFQAAIDHLLEKGVITAQWKPWIQKIKEHGHEAAHDLTPVTMERAETTLGFTQQLLELVYGTRHKMNQLMAAKNP
jgi:hypothetical protein